MFTKCPSGIYFCSNIKINHVIFLFREYFQNSSCFFFDNSNSFSSLFGLNIFYFNIRQTLDIFPNGFIKMMKSIGNNEYFNHASFFKQVIMAFIVQKKDIFTRRKKSKNSFDKRGLFYTMSELSSKRSIVFM